MRPRFIRFREWEVKELEEKKKNVEAAAADF
jgi:hypothetical protein